MPGRIEDGQQAVSVGDLERVREDTEAQFRGVDLALQRQREENQFLAQRYLRARERALVTFSALTVGLALVSALSFYLDHPGAGIAALGPTLAALWGLVGFYRR